MIEKWKPVPGYEGIYEASNTGKIKTSEGKTTYSDFHGVRVWSSRELKGRGDNPQTGKRVGLWKNKKCKDYLFARVIAATWLGLDMEEKYVAGETPTVNHKDGNRMNNALENLEVISLRKNVQHVFETGLVKSMRRIVLRDTETQQEIECRSYKDASIMLGRSAPYVSNCIRKRKKFLYTQTGKQFIIIHPENTGLYENQFSSSSQFDRCRWKTPITIKGVDNGHRSFNSFAECSRFLGRKPGYVSNTLKKKKKTLQHVNGTLYEVIK